MQVLARLTAHHDHPATLHFPEGHYLKGLHLRKW
jgi:23S rRNA G2069 N7-methylase RlmK/C1962 C5-methylase RlmI